MMKSEIANRASGWSPMLDFDAVMLLQVLALAHSGVRVAPGPLLIHT